MQPAERYHDSIAVEGRFDSKAGLACDFRFSQLRARRDIRRQCLIARGWRMVEPDEAGQARIAAMSRPDREAYFDRMLGATEVEPGATVTDTASQHRTATAAKHRAGGDDRGE